MKKIHKIISLSFVAALVMSVWGCTEAPEPDNGGGPSSDFIIERSSLNFNFTQAQEVVFIPVTTEIPEEKWKIQSSGEDWCKISKTYDNVPGLMLAVEQSEEAEIRKTEVKVGAGRAQYTITVRQLGYGPAILVSDMTVPASGGEVTLQVTANIDYEVGRPVLDSNDEAEWIERTQAEPTRAFAESGYGFYAQANTLPFQRTATVAVTAVDPMYRTASTVCNINQMTREVTVNDIPADYPVYASNVTANQPASEGSVDALIDGDYNSYYHSPYGSTTTKFPVEFEFTFDGTRNIDYVKIMHRAAYTASTGAVSAGHYNGKIGKFNVYYKNAEHSNWTLLTNTPIDFAQAGGYQQGNFPSTVTGATGIKISVLDGSYDFVTPAEVEFYESAKGLLNEALLKVFTDLSCSEIRPGVTRTEITELYGLSAFMAQVVAVPMSEGDYLSDYDSQFRINTYKPYSDNNLNIRLLTKKYTRMDNPTGIQVTAGDRIIVCVDQIPDGQSVSLAVYGEASDGYTANYGGMGTTDSVDQEVALMAGVNNINITATGMVYVMNTAASLSASSKSIKVHIPSSCGVVQGYFDLERHTDADYVDILSKYTYKYFVVKGRKMIFNFHASKLRQIAASGITSGIEAWDDIVSWQQELMGIDNLSYFNNHIMAVSHSGSAYMDASERRVNFGVDNALYKIISREQLLAQEDNTWGPAHELGHVNQGAINWKSCSESSNNLFSNYAIYKMGKYGSRGDALSELAASYAAKESWVLMGSSTHMDEDTELHMRMNWQLWNYYHRCGYNTKFWPTLFQMLRDDPLPSEFGGYFDMSEDPGASQLKFAEKACDAAQQDLTDFFEAWGFYRPVDVTYSQYGSARYRVTEEMIAASKARIAAKSYPKAAPMQYIEDRKVKGNTLYSDMGYYETFQNKTTITKTPKYSVSGRTYTVSDCDQAVAVELRRASTGTTLGELLYFSNLSSFTVPTGVDVSNAVLYAVQYDGARIRINN